MKPFLDPKRVTIKDMSLVPFTFNKVTLQVVSINGKEWCRVKEVSKALEYEKRTNDVVRTHVSGENVAHKYQQCGHFTVGVTTKWPKDSQKYDLYINEEGLYELVFSSQQPLAKAFRKH